MIILIAPSKSQDFDTPLPFKMKMVSPVFKEAGEMLAARLGELDQGALKKLMKLSDVLGEAVFNQFREFDRASERPALFSYTGTVFRHINPFDFSKKELAFGEKHLRILSGLYGILTPLSGIKPYRLEMKCSLEGEWGTNLSAFWKPRLTPLIEKETVINLASDEYTKALDRKKVSLISCRFLEGWERKSIGVYAKQARGEMVNFIIKEGITVPGDLKMFNRLGYQFDPAASGEKELVFLRL